jgi:tRNA G18 (ribose-2'-O)-methylase SpoU
MQNLQLDYRHHQPSRKIVPLCLLAHDIQTPANVGSLFRLADPLSAEEIPLTGRSALPPNRKFNKTFRSIDRRPRASQPCAGAG